MARNGLTGGLAMLAIGAVACGDRARGPAPVGRAVSPAAWTVERIVREPVAQVPVPGYPLLVLADGDLLALHEEGLGLVRVGPGGTVRWRSAWNGRLELIGAEAAGDDIWLVGRADHEVTWGQVLAFEAAPGGVRYPLVLVRLDAGTGVPQAARVLDEGDSEGAGFAIGLDSLVLVSVGVQGDSGLAPVRVRRLDRSLGVLAETATETTYVPHLEVDGHGVCVGHERRPRGDTPTRELWCLDPGLRERSRRPVGLDVETLWLRDGAPVAELTAVERGRLVLQRRGRPPLTITARCGLPGGGEVSPASCGPHALMAPGARVGRDREHLMLVAAVDVELGGTRVGIDGSTVILLDVGGDGRVVYSLHPGCGAVLPLGRTAAALRCGDRYDVIALSPDD